VAWFSRTFPAAILVNVQVQMRGPRKPEQSPAGLLAFASGKSGSTPLKQEPSEMLAVSVHQSRAMGEIMMLNLMCIGVVLIGLALVASHYMTEA
jgi:hypothetical protein